MHELAVTENILEIATRHAHLAGAGRIANIYLVIGQLSSIVDDSIQFYWDIIAKDTVAEGACLNFRRIPAELACLDCGKQFSINGEDYFCPDCHGIHVKIVSGEEFYLEAIEVEKEDG
ncbi:MAG: hydrogenase maturation nickel metallochaperone HypA [Anaerolineales bacterium]|jgi:hydrogenase nickel incorporation protein HypA/HybF